MLNKLFSEFDVAQYVITCDNVEYTVNKSETNDDTVTEIHSYCATNYNESVRVIVKGVFDLNKDGALIGDFYSVEISSKGNDGEYHTCSSLSGGKTEHVYDFVNAYYLLSN